MGRQQNSRFRFGCVMVALVPIGVAVLYLGWTTGRTALLHCQRQERYYIQCQKQQVYAYGLWAQPAVSIRLRSASVGEYREDDGDGGSYTAYKLDLVAYDGQSIELYRYGSDYNKAYTDLGKILEVLGNAGQPTLQIEKRNVWGDGFRVLMTLLIATFFGVPSWLVFLNSFQSRSK